MASFICGYNSKVRVGATVVTAHSSTVNVDTQEIDVTNFEGGGFADFLMCILAATSTIDAHWDALADPLDDPPNLRPAQIIANFFVYVNTLAGPFWSFPLATVKSFNFKTGAKEAVAFTSMVRNKGAFLFPTG